MACSLVHMNTEIRGMGRSPTKKKAAATSTPVPSTPAPKKKKSAHGGGGHGGGGGGNSATSGNEINKRWQEWTLQESIRRTMEFYKRLNGGEETTFEMETYVGESLTADRNRCLAYMMQEAGSFPKGTDILEVLEYYFMYVFFAILLHVHWLTPLPPRRCCSIMQDAESMATIAGSLANGGMCPVTNERIFSSSTVRDALSIMVSAGMYDDSGNFAFSMGFPCKSGVGGGLLIVIPNVCGICTFSPRLDRNGNSLRGGKFCEALSGAYAKALFVPFEKFTLTFALHTLLLQNVLSCTHLTSYQASPLFTNATLLSTVGATWNTTCMSSSMRLSTTTLMQ